MAAAGLGDGTGLRVVTLSSSGVEAMVDGASLGVLLAEDSCFSERTLDPARSSMNWGLPSSLVFSSGVMVSAKLWKLNIGSVPGVPCSGVSA